ncbi:MAG: hypothetical protein ABIP30_07665 [Ferruginibacter sp.]
MTKIIYITFFLVFISITARPQSGNNDKLIGKWIACKIIDSTDIGNIGLESLDSFKASVKEISKKKIKDLKGYLLDTVKNEDRKSQLIENFLTPTYNLFHGNWIEFCDNSTLIEHVNVMNGKSDNLFRTFEYDPSTKILIMDEHGMSESLRVYIISSDSMILSFYSEGLNLLVKRTE